MRWVEGCPVKQDRRCCAIDVARIWGIVLIAAGILLIVWCVPLRLWMVILGVALIVVGYLLAFGR